MGLVRGIASGLCVIGAVACVTPPAPWTVAEARSTAGAFASQDPEYRRAAVQAFWGDAAFMRECAPPGAPLAQAFDIYFEVQSSGARGRILVDPVTEVAQCVQRNTVARMFPKPDSSFVVHIALKFNP
jgi:hypothetical protein